MAYKSFKKKEYRGRPASNGFDKKKESNLARLTGLFKTKSGNLMGSTGEVVQGDNDLYIPEGTRFIIVDAKDTTHYDQVLLVALRDDPDHKKAFARPDRDEERPSRSASTSRSRGRTPSRGFEERD